MRLELIATTSNEIEMRLVETTPPERMLRREFIPYARIEMEAREPFDAQKIYNTFWAEQAVFATLDNFRIS